MIFIISYFHYYIIIYIISSYFSSFLICFSSLLHAIYALLPLFSRYFSYMMLLLLQRYLRALILRCFIFAIHDISSSSSFAFYILLHIIYFCFLQDMILFSSFLHKKYFHIFISLFLLLHISKIIIFFKMIPLLFSYKDISFLSY